MITKKRLWSWNSLLKYLLVFQTQPVWQAIPEISSIRPATRHRVDDGTRLCDKNWRSQITDTLARHSHRRQIKVSCRWQSISQHKGTNLLPIPLNIHFIFLYQDPKWLAGKYLWWQNCIKTFNSTLKQLLLSGIISFYVYKRMQFDIIKGKYFKSSLYYQKIKFSFYLFWFKIKNKLLKLFKSVLKTAQHKMCVHMCVCTLTQ